MVSEHSDKDSSLVTSIRYVYFQRRRVVVVSYSVYYQLRNRFLIGYFNQFAGKAYLKINLLVKMPFHRRSMEVGRSG